MCRCSADTPRGREFTCLFNWLIIVASEIGHGRDDCEKRNTADIFRRRLPRAKIKDTENE
jgi:hypothetical protein